jgi:hypothetical protein
VVQWLESSIGERDGFSKLRTVINADIRSDLRNICVYAFAFGMIADREGATEECVVRVSQYLVERGYLMPTELPRLVRAVGDAGRHQPQPVIAIIKRMLARKMGTADDAPVPDVLDFFDDPVRLTASIEKFLATTEHHKKLVEQWKTKKDAGKDVSEEGPEPSDVLGELTARAFFPGLSLASDQLTVRLNTTERPFSTNGEWNPKTGHVTWGKSMPEADGRTELPILLFAFWATPDTQFQRKHFGKTVLADQDLSTYCLWYHGLDAPEAEQWDHFLSDLSPGDDLVDRLKAFTFQGQPKPSEDSPEGLADEVRELLISGLEN